MPPSPPPPPPLLLLLLLVALSAVLLTTATDGRLEGDGAFVPRPDLVANGLRIIDLERKLEILKEKLEEVESVDPQRDINELLTRVVDLEGTHCIEGEFQCGGNEQECVSDLLVCDGHRDCHNNHDEDEDVCHSGPMKAGHIFSGISIWSDCRRRNDHVTRIVITQTQHRKYFRSRLFVKAHVTSYLEENGQKTKSEFAAKGSYNFATRVCLCSQQTTTTSTTCLSSATSTTETTNAPPVDELSPAAATTIALISM